MTKAGYDPEQQAYMVIFLDTDKPSIKSSTFVGWHSGWTEKELIYVKEKEQGEYLSE